jgi:N-acetylglucosaminyldiphosphoundecaprenol N-acetyl-beta-D-mannosaminyltransferase
VTPTRDLIRLLDVEVTAVAERDVPEVLGELISTGGRRTVVGHNLHSVYLYHTQAELMALYDSADLILLDGSPVFALWRIQQSRPRPGSHFRVGSTDWIRHLGEVPGLHRLAVVGAGRESNAEACRRLQGWLPSVSILGVAGEPWDRAREDFVVDQLTVFRPQLVLVGLGMPLQESVLWRRREALPEAVYCAVGGALDQISGRQRLAPRWLGRLGLEWLWRLLLSPRRVVGRVMVEPWKLAVLLLRRRRAASNGRVAP